MRHSIAGAAVVLLTSTALSAQLAFDESDKEGTLEVVVFGSNFAPILGEVAISARRVTNEGLDQPVRIDQRTASLKYGTYRLTVISPATYTVEKTLTIKDRYQCVIVGLFPASVLENDQRHNFIRGRLPVSSSQNGCRWVRLMSPLSEIEFADTKAADSGDFVFENIKPGKYLVVSLNARGICDVATTTVTFEPIQTLKLTTR